MRLIIKLLLSATVVGTLTYADDLAEGKKVFETYCWGCHHQTAVAFGPSFSQMAAKRTKQEIEAYIIEPKAMYKAFGHKRTVMPVLDVYLNRKTAASPGLISEELYFNPIIG